MTRDTDSAAPAPPHGAGASPFAGRVIGRYRLVREQGAGLFGTVWLAEDTSSGLPVALRVLPRELTDVGNVGETVRRRARAVIEASCSHPALVRVLEYGTTEDGRLFAVMDRVEGRRLDESHGSGRPDVLAALRLAIEMAAPLETLHNMGLVHGAVRPGNFALVDGRVVLMDVETIALRDAPALQSLVAARSPAAYLAPEQIRGGPITEKTDVYGFALTLYELLVGRPPFEGDTRETLHAQQLTAEPASVRRIRRTVPPLVDSTLLEALDKVPERRPFMSNVLNHLLTEAGESPSRWKRPAVAVAAVALVVAIGAGVTWSVVASRSSSSAPTPATLPDTASTPASPVSGTPPATPDRDSAAARGTAEPVTASGDAGSRPVAGSPGPMVAPPTPTPSAIVPPAVSTPTADASPAPAPSPVPAPPVATEPPRATPPLGPAKSSTATPSKGIRPPRPAPAVTGPPTSRSTAAVPPSPQALPRLQPPDGPSKQSQPSAAAGTRPARQAPARSAQEPDPADVIDWLINRRGSD